MFNLDQILKSLQSDPGSQRTAMTGAAGLATGMMLGGGIGKHLGGIAQMGAVAALGGLAYNAWQKHQQLQTDDAGPAPTPRDAFIPAGAHEQEELGKVLVRAMIAAAKADGKVDAEEKEKIFAKLETMPLSAAEKAWVFEELAAPLDINKVVAGADTPEHAAEIYAASLVAMTADTAAERAYLEALANKLNLEPGLVHQIQKAAEGLVEEPAPKPASGFSFSPNNV